MNNKIFKIFLVLSVVFVAVLTSQTETKVISQQQKAVNQVILPQNDSSDRIFGLTIDESFVGDDSISATIFSELELIKKSKPENRVPTVRLVLPALCKKKAEKDDRRKEFKKGDCISFNTEILDQYVNLVNKLKTDNLADVMIEIMDSSDKISPNCFVKQNLEQSVNCYQSLTKFLYNYKKSGESRKLGEKVDIWEVGNEINMPEYGIGKKKPFDDRRKIIVNQIKSALDYLKGENAKTAITYYFNGYKNRINYSDEKDSMLSWLKNEGEHFKDKNNQKISFSNVDYVLISYYPDDNFYELPQTIRSKCDSTEELEELPIDLTVADWVEIIKEFTKHYDAATKFGLGEMGTHCRFKTCENASCPERRNVAECKLRETGYCPKAQIDIINEDYDRLDKEIRKTLRLDSLEDRFVGGYFYWYYSRDVINNLAKGNEAQKTNARNTGEAIKTVYQKWNEPIEIAGNLNLLQDRDETEPQINVLRNGDTGKENPYTIVIINNPFISSDVGFERDPINDDRGKFDRSVNYIYANLFGRMPGQVENFLEDKTIADKIRVISIWVNVPPGEANCFIQINGQFEARQTAITNFFDDLNKKFPGINVRPDVVFSVTGWEHIYKATAFAAREEDCQKGVGFWFDKIQYKHCLTSSQPGAVAINADDDSMTALHEFGHAASSYQNGYVDDLSYKGFSCGDCFTINKKRKRWFDRPKEFAVYYLDGTDPNDLKNHYAQDKSDSRTETGILAPIKNAPDFPAVMDNYNKANEGRAEKCQHDKLTRQFLLDRIYAKTTR